MVFLIYPIHLFENIDEIIKSGEGKIVIIEDPIYFSDWERKLIFNKKKLVFHRATMKVYYEYLKNNDNIKKNGISVKYVEWNNVSTKKKWLNIMKKMENIVCYDPVDKLLEERLNNVFKNKNEKITLLESPQFITTRDDLNVFYNNQKQKGLKRIFNQTAFYKWQRERLNILMTKSGKPIGGRLTFDIYNRGKLPEDVKIPALPFQRGLSEDARYLREAELYVNKLWKGNYGDSDGLIFPISNDKSREWFDNFMKKRFLCFGEYQDAITDDNENINNPILFHSGISALHRPKRKMRQNHYNKTS